MNRRDLERLVGEQMALNALNATQLRFPWGDGGDAEPAPKLDPVTLAEYLDEHSDEIEDEATLWRLLLNEKRLNPKLEVMPARAFMSGIRFITAGKRTDRSRTGLEPEHLFIQQHDGTWEHTTPDEFLEHLLSGPDDVSHYLRQDPDEQFNRDFWADPAPLYHGTKDLEGVLKSGIEPRSESRGLGNRGVDAAVFTSLELSGTESYSHDPDGGTVEIDTAAMKRAGTRPRVTREPQVTEYEALEAVAHKIGVEWTIDLEQGIDPQTVIVHGHVPARFLRVVE